MPLNNHDSRGVYGLLAKRRAVIYKLKDKFLKEAQRQQLTQQLEIYNENPIIASFMSKMREKVRKPK